MIVRAHTRARPARGFTLIELLIVVAIIVILAAIAIAAYQKYLKEAQIAKVYSHYDDAIRAVRAEMPKRVAQLSRGDPNLVALNYDFVINRLLDPEGRATAPLGGPAFVQGPADSVAGAIGVTIGGGGRPGTEIVLIERPAFLEDVTASSTAIYANSAQ